MEIDFSKLLEAFREKYAYIYDRRDAIPHYGELVDAGDAFIKRHPDFVGKFTAFRRDCLTSDREVAAFMLALDSLYR